MSSLSPSPDGAQSDSDFSTNPNTQKKKQKKTGGTTRKRAATSVNKKQNAPAPEEDDTQPQASGSRRMSLREASSIRRPGRYREPDEIPNIKPAWTHPDVTFNPDLGRFVEPYSLPMDHPNGFPSRERHDAWREEEERKKTAEQQGRPHVTVNVRSEILDGTTKGPRIVRLPALNEVRRRQREQMAEDAQAAVADGSGENSNEQIAEDGQAAAAGGSNEMPVNEQQLANDVAQFARQLKPIPKWENLPKSTQWILIDYQNKKLQAIDPDKQLPDAFRSLYLKLKDIVEFVEMYREEEALYEEWSEHVKTTDPSNNNLNFYEQAWGITDLVAYYISDRDIHLGQRYLGSLRETNVHDLAQLKGRRSKFYIIADMHDLDLKTMKEALSWGFSSEYGNLTRNSFHWVLNYGLPDTPDDADQAPLAIAHNNAAQPLGLDGAESNGEEDEDEVLEIQSPFDRNFPEIVNPYYNAQQQEDRRPTLTIEWPINPPQQDDPVLPVVLPIERLEPVGDAADFPLFGYFDDDEDVSNGPIPMPPPGAPNRDAILNGVESLDPTQPRPWWALPWPQGFQDVPVDPQFLGQSPVQDNVELALLDGPIGQDLQAKDDAEGQQVQQPGEADGQDAKDNISNDGSGDAIDDAPKELWDQFFDMDAIAAGTLSAEEMEDLDLPAPKYPEDVLDVKDLIDYPAQADDDYEEYYDYSAALKKPIKYGPTCDPRDLTLAPGQNGLPFHEQRYANPGEASRARAAMEGRGNWGVSPRQSPGNQGGQLGLIYQGNQNVAGYPPSQGASSHDFEEGLAQSAEENRRAEYQAGNKGQQQPDNDVALPEDLSFDPLWYAEQQPLVFGFSQNNIPGWGSDGLGNYAYGEVAEAQGPHAELAEPAQNAGNVVASFVPGQRAPNMLIDPALLGMNAVDGQGMIALDPEIVQEPLPAALPRSDPAQASVPNTGTAPVVGPELRFNSMALPPVTEADTTGPERASTSRVNATTSTATTPIQSSSSNGPVLLSLATTPEGKAIVQEEPASPKKPAPVLAPLPAPVPAALPPSHVPSKRDYSEFEEVIEKEPAVTPSRKHGRADVFLLESDDDFSQMSVPICEADDDDWEPEAEQQSSKPATTRKGRKTTAATTKGKKSSGTPKGRKTGVLPRTRQTGMMTRSRSNSVVPRGNSPPASPKKRKSTAVKAHKTINAAEGEVSKRRSNKKQKENTPARAVAGPSSSRSVPVIPGQVSPGVGTFRGPRQTAPSAIPQIAWPHVVMAQLANSVDGYADDEDEPPVNIPHAPAAPAPRNPGSVLPTPPTSNNPRDVVMSLGPLMEDIEEAAAAQGPTGAADAAGATGTIIKSEETENVGSQPPVAKPKRKYTKRAKTGEGNDVVPKPKRQRTNKVDAADNKGKTAIHYPLVRKETPVPLPPMIPFADQKGGSSGGAQNFLAHPQTSLGANSGSQTVSETTRQAADTSNVPKKTRRTPMSADEFDARSKRGEVMNFGQPVPAGSAGPQLFAHANAPAPVSTTQSYFVGAPALHGRPIIPQPTYPRPEPQSLTDAFTGVYAPSSVKRPMPPATPSPEKTQRVALPATPGTQEREKPVSKGVGEAPVSQTPKRIIKLKLPTARAKSLAVEAATTAPSAQTSTPQDQNLVVPKTVATQKSKTAHKNEIDPKTGRPRLGRPRTRQASQQPRFAVVDENVDVDNRATKKAAKKSK